MLSGAGGFAASTVVVSSDDRFLAAQQLADIGIAPREILLAPGPFDLFVAVAIAVARIAATDPDGLVLLSPGDRSVRPDSHRAFARAMSAAAEEARGGKFVRFSCARHGETVDPGWLVASATALSQMVERAAPGAWSAAEQAAATAAPDLDFVRIGATEYEQCPSASFDELFDGAGPDGLTHAIDFAPSLAASWAGLPNVMPDRRDAAGNLAYGDTVLLDARDCVVNAGERLVVLDGVSNLAVIVTDDAVLATDISDPKADRRPIAALQSLGRNEAVAHRQERRPWGGFKSLTEGPRYQVKRITMKPGAATSLQKHHHRAEHWVVVAGVAEVTIDSETRILQENESAYLPLGCAHRLANPGKIPLEIIEVQTGSYLGEDDIIRLDDPYKRGNPGA